MHKIFLAELQQEVFATRKIPEAVPVGKAIRKPQEKSMTFRRLAVYCAKIPSWVVDILDKDELVFSTDEYKRYVPKTTPVLPTCFDK